MQGRVETTGRRNRGSFPKKSAAVTQIRSYRPHAHSPLINCACSYVPSLTPRRAQPQQQQAPFHLPEKAASKGAPAVANGRERGNPHPIPFRQRNWAPSLLRSRGSKAGPSGVSTAAPGQQSQGRLRASLYEAEAQASETLGTPCVVSETGREVSEWDPTVGRHQATEAQRTASAPTRETLRYSWSASPDR